MFSNELWQKSGVPATYSIDQSIRFNKPDSSVLTKTYGSEGTKTAFTMSCWIKPTLQANYGFLFGASTSNDAWNVTTGSHLSWSSNTLAFYSGGTNYIITNRVFRDPSAWYHIVLAVNTAGSGTDKIKLYVNGTLETSFSTDNRSSISGDLYIGDDVLHFIGGQVTTGTTNAFWDGYIAEFYYIDGSQLTADSFAETNSNGIWIPKEYSGSYGSNGVHIDGRDASDLGDDESGNGNDFTASGLASHDQVSDSPTNNFAVLNPVDTYGKLAGEIRNGNLELRDNSASVYVYGRATFGFDVTDSNGFYWESCDVVDGSGIGGITEDNTALPSGSSLAFTGARGYNSINTSNHYKLENTTYNSVDLGVASNAGDIVQFCVKNGKLFIGVNGTYVLSGNPATEANPLFTGLTGIFMPFAGLYSGASYNTVYNFGQDGTFAGNKTAQGNTDANGNGNFFYAPPSGAKALCSKSLGS